MGRRILRPAGFALLVGALAAPLAGQGSSVYNHSACASARGGAAVAAPCADGSSVYYNPALLSLLPSTAAAGLNAIYNEGDFTFDTTGVVVERDPAVPLVPHAYASFRFGPSRRLAAGVGLWAPYGLGIEWPETFEGRFISWKTRLQGIYVQPSLAYQVVPGKLAIGGGVQIVSGGLEINQHVDAPVADDALAFLGVPLGTDIASVRLKGTDIGFGGQLAVYYQVTDNFSLGARYMFPVTVDLSGDATFEQIPQDNLLLIPDLNTGATMAVPLDSLVAPLFGPGGPLEDQGVGASLTFPPQAVVGFQWGMTDRLGIMADYQWTGWSTFDEILASFDGNAPDLALTLNYKNTSTYRGGLTYELGPGFDGRAGFIYNTAASPDETVTPILPEAERQLYTVGFGYRMGAIQADLYYNFVNQADRRGRVRSELPPSFIDESGEQLNVGVYRTTAHLVGLTLSYVFGDR